MTSVIWLKVFEYSHGSRNEFNPTGLFSDDADLLSERRATYRPRLHRDGNGRDRPLSAARRSRRAVPDRYRRARAEDAASRDRRGADAASARRPQLVAVSRHDGRAEYFL